MSLKPLRLLSTFCWYSLWGLRRLHVFFCFSEFSTAENTWTPFPQAAVWAPASPFSFSFVVLPCSDPAGSLQIPLAPSRQPVSPSAPQPLSPAVPTSVLVPTVSTAKCDALIFFFCFCFCMVFVVLFLIFPFLLRLCPEKTSFACFLLFLHTFVYITFTSLFSIVCAKTDRFKRVSKKLF